MRTHRLDETALPVATDPRQYARVVARAHDAVVSGCRPAVSPRQLIVESWHRARSQGVNPDHGAESRPVSAGEVERRRVTCGITDDALLVLRGGLVPAAESGGHIVVIVDVEGRVLWRDGHPGVFRQADRLGFVEGACWLENTVGTNAIGTALVEGVPVQVQSAEHYVRSHHAWTCAAAPIRDPRDGLLLGAVDVSGPAGTMHPSTLALVRAVAGLAEAKLRDAHRTRLDRLRAVAAPLLAKIDGQALVVDPNGWVAASTGLPPMDRIALPDRLDSQEAWLPAFGACSLEPLPEGILLRPCAPDAPSAARVVVDVRRSGRPALTVHRTSGNWTYRLSGRHAEILLDLAENRAGRTAAELAEQLFGDRTRTITVRAEMSRLRKRFGDLLDHRPYRFLADLDVTAVR
ncbi:GAF domain-containing protein [Saccharopolyspora shandongensis]|uniref:GAF domain-containing protein n=1 Tax=Saccharopolyspora shandongensis TaxID=418495 RepID=A0A1H2QJJ4_9PSEU|nr:helix-turn-helix domain-containing protein [Saccharopolyspora shandongensis]SDW07048.1 GAF domain-containing protein [Saccharopolyspora shandongensis]